MRALVFSAGGSFCAYQAGVWQALEEYGWRPQVVVGVSAGAVNALAVARGCPANRLQQWWLEARANVFRWNWPPRGGTLFDRRPLEARLRELERDLPLAGEGSPLLLVTVAELPSTRIRVIREREVTSERLLASCAIPFLYGPLVAEIAGQRRWVVDGGAFERLPLAVAAQAGATEIVSVDVLAAPPSRVWRTASNAVARLRRAWTPDAGDLNVTPSGVQVMRLDPTSALGTMPDMVRWEQEKIERWIEAGYREARDRLRTTRNVQHSIPSNERATPV